MEKLTIGDIARLAGVSTSTVSRVLNDKHDVNPDTREKIMSIVRETGYQQNKSAINLTKQNSINVLFLVTRLYSYTENEVLSGFINSTKDSHIEYSIVESQFDYEFAREYINTHCNKYDYIVYFAINKDDYKDFKDIRTPMVFVGQESKFHMSITVDNKQVMNQILSNYRTKKSMLYIALPDTDYTSGYLRTKYVKHFCKNNDIHLDIITSDFSPKKSYELIKSVDITKYDLVGCATDKIALAADRHRINSHKGNISLFGIGNYTDLNFSMENFITVDLDFKSAGSLLSSIIVDKNYNDNLKITVGTKLIVA